MPPTEALDELASSVDKRMNTFRLLQRASIVTGGILLLGFGIETNDTMPGYAVIFVDDASKTYIAPQCVNEWQNKPTKTLNIIRRTTADEARKLNYEPDYDCRETGAFAPDGRTLIGLILVKIGILSPISHWWDQPYRTEEGIVWPSSKPPHSN